MEYPRWAPLYEQIRQEFGFSWDREEAAAARLRELLPPAALERPLERLAHRLEGKEVVVVGLAPRAGPPPLWRRPFTSAGVAVVAADGAASACLEAGLVPDVIVTDLDGPVASEVTANRRGALVVVHAHGDNRELLDEWVPQLPGELAGTWAGPPGGGLMDAGGFTDGDRSAFLAEAAGAVRILLWGFDLEHAEEGDPAARLRKEAKLRWAGRVLGELARSGRAPVETWNPDGTLSPYKAGGISGASTK
ncbi:MAG: 6-hydroxymethylpterin diphosphokinase MptE-like protein [Thermoplasmata archaeon]